MGGSTSGLGCKTNNGHNNKNKDKRNNIIDNSSLSSRCTF
jgi:hypothetical protein